MRLTVNLPATNHPSTHAKNGTDDAPREYTRTCQLRPSDSKTDGNNSRTQNDTPGQLLMEREMENQNDKLTVRRTASNKTMSIRTITRGRLDSPSLDQCLLYEAICGQLSC